MTAPLEIDGAVLDRSRLDALVAAATRDADALGLGPGDGIAVAAGDPLGTVVAAAVAAAGGAAIVHTWQPLAELAREPHRRWARLWSTGGDAIAVAPAARRADAPELPAEAGALLWTSGSSGAPRMAVLPRSGLVQQAQATAERLGVGGDDVLLLPLPVDHAYGFSVIELARATGARLRLETAPSARRVVRRLRTGRVTMLDGFPSLYRQLLAIARRDAEVAALLAAPRVRGCGGDVLAPALARDFLDGVGASLHDGYGLTEAGPNVALSAPGHQRLGCAGRALRGVELRLARDGELLVRSPGTMLGYLDDAPATHAALGADGWLRTGDLAALDDDGFLTVVGRKKQVIVVHGECHAPAQIEAAALTAGVVAEAVAVGRPGGHPLGDHITLFVQRGERTGDDVERDVAAACRALPVHLRPHAIVVLDALPRVPTGKPDRDALRRAAAMS
ncbi:MAG TPA: fatty acid--CoA ligase family protein [Conexibacter sp.]|nr:fatty acid--CoA ligase family protein [Conexibacter sp.]